MTEKPTYEEVENRIKKIEKAEVGRELLKEGKRKGQENYRDIANRIPGIVYQLIRHKDGSFSVPFMSDRVYEYSGYKPREIMAEPSLFFKTIHPEDIEFIQEQIIQSAKKLEDLSAEHRLTTVDGKTMWFHMKATPRLLDNGNMFWDGISIDITERKRSRETLLESENRFKALFDYAPDAYYLNDFEGKLLDGNKAAEQLIGYKKEELIGSNFFKLNLLPKSEIQKAASILEKNAKRLPTGPDELILRHRDDGRIAVEIRTFPINIKGQDMVLGIARDISERKLAEKALRESEDRYKSLTNNLNIGIYRNTAGVKGRFLEANPSFVEMFGFDSRDELLKVNVSDLYENPDDRKKINAKLLKDGAIRNEELRLRKKDGTPFTGSASAVTVKDKKGKVKYFDGVIEDITKRKRLEAGLRESEARLKGFYNAAFEGIVITDQGKIVDVNHRLCEIYGYSQEELIGRDVMMLIAEEDRELVLKNIRSGYDKPYEHKSVHKNGSEVVVEVHSQQIKYHERTMRVTAVHDITERKLAEKALIEERNKARKYLDLANVTFVALDASGNVTLINKKGYELLGYKEFEIIGKNWFDNFLPQKTAEKLAQGFGKILSGETEIAEYSENPILTRQGEERFIAWHNTVLRDNNEKVVATLSSGHDITDQLQAEEDRKILETQLQQAQKMEAIGTLAGGIAHDFNNILSSIFGYSELAHSDIQEGSKVHYYIEQILHAAYRARDLVKQILLFSRQRDQEQKPIKISPIVKEVSKLLRATIPTTIEIHTNISASSDTVFANSSQVHQVIMNLCTNAAHATRETGGILRISLAETMLDSNSMMRFPDLKEGAYLRLRVSDTGKGIPSQYLDRIFDPFFTTKRRGEGTGLGLSVVHGIVKNHGGAIMVDSEPGKGTTFDVFLPMVPESPKAETEKRLESMPKGSERILFVDDEPSLTILAEEMLKVLGYQAVTRTSSIEALEAFRSEPAKFDVVITDQTMPMMTGADLSKEILRIRPDIPIILCTGFSEQITPEEANRLGIKEFLFKPLITRNLAEAIRRVLI